MPYSLFKHRHNFAAWAAARGAQRQFTSVKNMVLALERSGIRKTVEKDSPPDVTRAEFQKLHRRWCRTILRTWKAQGLSKGTYGRAAKLVGLYLKAMIVNGGYSNTALAREAHPPVDRILLQKLAKKETHQKPDRATWRKAAWTTLEEGEYYTLIETLRNALKPGQPFWMLEEDWDPTELAD